LLRDVLFSITAGQQAAMKDTKNLPVHVHAAQRKLGDGIPNGAGSIRTCPVTLRRATSRTLALCLVRRRRPKTDNRHLDT
jgi:hypothetical protein